MPRHSVCTGAVPCPDPACCRYALPGSRCALLVAAEGEHTVAEIGVLLDCSKERVRQLIASAIEKLRSRDGAKGLADFFDRG